MTKMISNLAKKFLQITFIAFILMVSIVSAQEALAVGLNVYVNLYHSNSGSTRVCVNSVYQNLGCRVITLSGVLSPYTSGPFTFGENVIPVGGQFRACTVNLANNQYNCATGTNSPAKVPEYVSVTVPSSSGGGINWEDLCVRYHALIGVTEQRCHILAHGTVITPAGNGFLACALITKAGPAVLGLPDILSLFPC